jgi:hypothetical protein
MRVSFVKTIHLGKEKPRMMNGLKTLQYAVLFLLITMCLPLLGQEKNDDPTQLLNHLAGNWVLEGVLGGRHSTHDVTAEWILNHEYLRFHEVSREKNKNGGPVYEAIVIMSWDNKTNEYLCLWLDNTEGGGLSAPIARAKRDGRSIPIIFPPPNESLHTTFTYDDAADRWHLSIDDVKDGKPDRFGDVTLTRSHRALPPTGSRRPQS